jgi:hypothetical protein
MHKNIPLAYTHMPLQIPWQCLMQDPNHHIQTLGYYPSQLLVDTQNYQKRSAQR